MNVSRERENNGIRLTKIIFALSKIDFLKYNRQ